MLADVLLLEEACASRVDLIDGRIGEPSCALRSRRTSRRTGARKRKERQSVGTNNSVAKPSVRADPNGIGAILETGGIVRLGTDHPSPSSLIVNLALHGGKTSEDARIPRATLTGALAYRTMPPR
jgi:hypothetical protein